MIQLRGRWFTPIALLVTTMSVAVLAIVAVRESTDDINGSLGTVTPVADTPALPADWTEFGPPLGPSARQDLYGVVEANSDAILFGATSEANGVQRTRYPSAWIHDDAGDVVEVPWTEEIRESEDSFFTYGHLLADRVMLFGGTQGSDGRYKLLQRDLNLTRLRFEHPNFPVPAAYTEWRFVTAASGEGQVQLLLRNDIGATTRYVLLRLDIDGAGAPIGWTQTEVDASEFFETDDAQLRYIAFVGNRALLVCDRCASDNSDKVLLHDGESVTVGQPGATPLQITSAEATPGGQFVVLANEVLPNNQYSMQIWTSSDALDWAGPTIPDDSGSTIDVFGRVLSTFETTWSIIGTKNDELEVWVSADSGATWQSPSVPTVFKNSVDPSGRFFYTKVSSRGIYFTATRDGGEAIAVFQSGSTSRRLALSKSSDARLGISLEGIVALNGRVAIWGTEVLEQIDSRTETTFIRESTGEAWSPIELSSSIRDDLEIVGLFNVVDEMVIVGRRDGQDDTTLTFWSSHEPGTWSEAGTLQLDSYYQRVEIGAADGVVAVAASQPIDGESRSEVFRSTGLDTWRRVTGDDATFFGSCDSSDGVLFVGSSATADEFVPRILRVGAANTSATPVFLPQFIIEGSGIATVHSCTSLADGTLALEVNTQTSPDLTLVWFDPQGPAVRELSAPLLPDGSRLLEAVGLGDDVELVFRTFAEGQYQLRVARWRSRDRVFDYTASHLAESVFPHSATRTVRIGDAEFRAVGDGRNVFVFYRAAS